MAMIKAETADGFAAMPALRQVGLIIALAASIALGVWVAMWSQTPSYSLLYGNLSANDSSAVLDALQKAGIPYKVDDTNGAVMVPAGRVHDARLKLASTGLPKGNGVGFELLGKEQELGTSQFLEQARYQHALEVELARSIQTMQNVKNVRVHLAIPKKSVFIRKQEATTASVVLDLYTGRRVSDEQVASIVHLVAASIPSLEPEKVTVVDQSGNLLTRGLADRHMAMTASQFDYARRLEETFRTRIENLISPIVGPGRVRAQVVADIDFTQVEKTRESYDPDLPAVRSEQVVEESNGSAMGASGVPGALSNQPPAGGSTEQAGDSVAPGNSNGSSSKRVTKNYELDRTISHIRTPSGAIRRMSVAVLVDDLATVGADGTEERTPLTEEQITRISDLVKDAVGFDARRGDSINVVNTSFHQPAPPEPLPEQAIWEQPWVWDVGKQALAALFVIIVLFGVIKPTLKNLTEKGVEQRQLAAATAVMQQAGEEGGMPGEAGAMGGAQAQLPPPTAQVEEHLTQARQMVQQDPARVAQVVKTWVASDG